ncbi:MAG: LacI family DNA-binding transcriptional regulator [Thermomicrobiales bacterium]
MLRHRMENAVTLEEIAHLAGVSRSTVSRVVNGDRRVSDAARARVQDVIRDHNYHPNAAARSLASRRMRVLGLLITKSVGGLFTDPFYPILIQGTADACNAVDHTLTMLMDTSPDGHAVEQLYSRVIRGRHVDGLVLACHAVDDPIVAQLQADRIPFVLVGRHPGAEVSFVDVDSRGAAREAVAHLLGHGYRKIAMICGPPNLIATIDRHAGYVTALQEAAVPPEPSRVVFADFTQRGGHRAMQKLLQDRAELPDAVFAASDALAFGAVAAIQEAGLRVPDDIAVMGFDGLAEGIDSQPPLSTVTQPVADFGREAVRMVLETIDDPDRAPVQRFLPTQLTLRRSCGCEVASVDEVGGGVVAEPALSTA